jgi:hypothetical protein
MILNVTFNGHLYVYCDYDMENPRFLADCHRAQIDRILKRNFQLDNKTFRELRRGILRAVKRGNTFTKYVPEFNDKMLKPSPNSQTRWPVSQQLNRHPEFAKPKLIKAS